jgi:hypothetical protein
VSPFGSGSPIEGVSHTPSNAAVPRMQDLATGR